MKIQTVQYQKVFNLGNYSNEKIGVDISISDGDDPLEAFAEAKKLVEKSHKFFVDLPTYEHAKKVVANEDDYTGREVKSSKQVIEAFEENYPDYLGKFMMPVSRSIEAPPTPYEPKDDYEIPC